MLVLNATVKKKIADAVGAAVKIDTDTMRLTRVDVAVVEGAVAEVVDEAVKAERAAVFALMHEKKGDLVDGIAADTQKLVVECLCMVAADCAAASGLGVRAPTTIEEGDAIFREIASLVAQRGHLITSIAEVLDVGATVGLIDAVKSLKANALALEVDRARLLDAIDGYLVEDNIVDVPGAVAAVRKVSVEVDDMQKRITRLVKEVADLNEQKRHLIREKQSIVTGIGADGADDETAALIFKLTASVKALVLAAVQVRGCFSTEYGDALENLQRAAGVAGRSIRFTPQVAVDRPGLLGVYASAEIIGAMVDVFGGSYQEAQREVMVKLGQLRSPPSRTATMQELVAYVAGVPSRPSTCVPECSLGMPGVDFRNGGKPITVDAHGIGCTTLRARDDSEGVAQDADAAVDAAFEGRYTPPFVAEKVAAGVAAEAIAADDATRETTSTRVLVDGGHKGARDEGPAVVDVNVFCSWELTIPRSTNLADEDAVVEAAKKALTVYLDEEKAEVVADCGVDRVHVDDGAVCTGLSAMWCPIHGDCRCAKTPTGEPNFEDPACPLHSTSSMHAADLDDEASEIHGDVEDGMPSGMIPGMVDAVNRGNGGES